MFLIALYMHKPIGVQDLTTATQKKQLATHRTNQNTPFCHGPADKVVINL